MTNYNQRSEQPIEIIEIPEGYSPSEDEEFMNSIMLAYFKQKLIIWRQDLLKDLDSTIENLQHNNDFEPDLNDRASSELQRNLELQARSRDRQVVSKIDGALSRIEDGSYGYCEISDEPISIKRLEARPIATMTVSVQEQYEKNKGIGQF